jgi:hypothetical protein
MLKAAMEPNSCVMTVAKRYDDGIVTTLEKLRGEAVTNTERRDQDAALVPRIGRT